MLACPACDNLNDDQARRCVRCGAELPQQPTNYEAPGTRPMARTFLGVMPVVERPVAASTLEPLTTTVSAGGFSALEPAPTTLAGPKPQLAQASVRQNHNETVSPHPKTLSGLSTPKARTLQGFGATSIVEPPRDANAPQTSNPTGLNEAPAEIDAEKTPVNQLAFPGNAALKGTLMGVAPFSPAAPPVPSQDPQVVVPRTTNPSLHRTMLGVAPPIDVHANTSPTRGREEATPIAVGFQSVPPTNASYHKGTLLGVAMPGIAPLHPGVQKNEPPNVDFNVPTLPPERKTPLPDFDAPPRGISTTEALETTTQVALQRASQRKRLAWVFGLAASLLVVIIVVATLVWWKTIHLTVSVVTSDTNAEQLEITCSNCQTGTAILLQGQSATFVGGQAKLTLPKKLSIGVNRLVLEVKRPNRSRSEIVNATVPVEFRVTSDLSAFAKDRPQLLVVVEAMPQTRIQIDGRTLTVGADNKLTVPVEVSEQLLGTNPSPALFERKLDYTVTQRDGAVVSGSLTVKTGITPLELTSPGLEHITPTATFTLSGRTSPKAKLTANSHPLSVAADGTFRQEMALSAPGSTRLRVRSHEDGIAPRLVDISLERVTNLRQRADELGRSLPTDYDAITKLVSDTPASLVALHGEVIAQESTGTSTRLVVSTNCVQTPCLASVRYGAQLTLKRGARIIAIGRGRLTKRASGDARDLTIEASLVVEEPQK